MPNTNFTKQDVLSTAFDSSSNSIDVHGNYRFYFRSNSNSALKMGPGRFIGFTVFSHTGATIKFQNHINPLSGTTILNTITLPAGYSHWIMPRPIQFDVGLSALVTGTIDYEVYWI